MLALLAFVAAFFGGVPSFASSIKAVDVSATHVTLRFDGPVGEASALLVPGPERIAIDVSGATPGQETTAFDGPVARVRQGQQNNGARVVLDLARPAIVTEGRFDPEERTLTLALATVDEAVFERAAADGRMRFLPPMSWLPAPTARGYSASMPIPVAGKQVPLPKVYGDASRPLVVIDAGHGGHDPGALSPDGNLREKDLTLKAALAIRDELLATGRVRVALTRSDDRFLILQERYGIARRLGASLFISVHCDSAGNHEASGGSIYTLSETASDKEAARLAARENKSDIIAGVDLGDATPDISSILIDLTQRETMNTSASFARLLAREARPLMPLKGDYHRMASLVVLKAPDMPSALFEMGYLSNQKDADFLNSIAGRAKIAESIRRAVEIHFATRMASR